MNTKIWTPVGNRHGFRCGGKEGQRNLRQTRREHVMDPQSEGKKTGSDRRKNDPRVADDRALGKSRHDHRHQRDRRQEDDVDFRMAEYPKQMLPQERIAAACRVEEWPAEHPLHLEQDVAGDQWREGEQDHAGHDEEVPGKERHEVDAHPRCTAFHDADDQFDRRGDRSNFNEGQAKKPYVGADAGKLLVGGERRIHEPARRWRRIEEDRAAHEDTADEKAPEAESAEPGKWQFACAEHRRQQEDRHGLEDWHGEQEHHHRAMQRERLVVKVRGHELVAWQSQLQAHQQRQCAGEEHEGEGSGSVPETDLIVVDRRPVEPTGRVVPNRPQTTFPYRALRRRKAGGLSCRARRALSRLADRPFHHFSGFGRAHSSPFSHAAMARISSGGSMSNDGIFEPGLMASGRAMKRAINSSLLARTPAATVCREPR